MTLEEAEVRRRVVEAGHKLVELGLVARTWGNLSARLSLGAFVITPSGRAYETLLPEDLVTVSMADGKPLSGGRPSSEKGIHYAVYRLRPEVGFVIHTHQDCASAVGVTGRNLEHPEDPALGECVPCAAYGMPSTKKLCAAVTAAVSDYPESNAFLMRHHGALLLGRTEEEAFLVAQALERVCAARLPEIPAGAVRDWGDSVRQGDAFLLRINGTETRYTLNGNALPPEAALHAAIYRTGGETCILQARDSAVASISRGGGPLRPMLDDLAQIAGEDIHCANPAVPSDVAKKLKGRNAVLLRSAGALCTGRTESDAEAVRMILQKDCRAQLFAAGVPGVRPLKRTDAQLQRLFYTLKYAKRKQEGGKKCGKD